MKNLFQKFIIPLIGFLLSISPAVSGITAATAITPFGVFICLTAIAVALILFTKNHAPKAYGQGIEVELWVNYIIGRLFKDNVFLEKAYNDDQYVVAGKIVHIPQPGSAPTVVKNRSAFPAAAVRRTDTDIVYTLDEYSTDPTHIHDAETVQLSYSKMDSVIGDHIGYLSETVGDDIILKWLSGIPATNIIKTTGPATVATAPSATGNRKAAVHKDLRKAQLALNLQNIPKGDRFGLLDDNMADQVFESLSDTQQRVFTEYADAKTGVIGRLYGFDLMTRSTVAAATDEDVIRALGEAGDEDDSLVSMFWHKNAVARAKGETKPFENLDDPQYYGDIYSFLTRMGGRRRRADNKGIIALIQAPSA